MPAARKGIRSDVMTTAVVPASRRGKRRKAPPTSPSSSRRGDPPASALAAWQQCAGASAARCDGVDVLKENRSTAVYRLRGAGPGDSPVIAKRCGATVADVERTIYESILPQLPLRSVAYY